MRRDLSAARVLVPAGLLALAGCGPALAPVRGTVSLHDGSPLKDAVLVFERADGGKPSVSARGYLKPDGSFQLGTYTPDGGVPPGRYRALVAPIDLSDAPDPAKYPFDARYLAFDTSGLEFDVSYGRNEIPIRLDGPARGRPARR